MSSRKEQKEALRRERLERERQAQAAARRKKLIGYGAGGLLALAAIVIVAVLLLSGGGGGGGESAGDMLPDGGNVPAQQITDLTPAAKAAGCELKSAKGKPAEHTASLGEGIEYDTDPPSVGKHFQAPAEDGAYGDEAPDPKEVVHSHEHGRVVFWFKPSLPEEARANLKALFDQDSYQLILTPNTTMPYEVAATAWNRDPRPNGTGRLMGCRRYGEKVLDALQTFRDEHRGQGPEAVP